MIWRPRAGSFWIKGKAARYLSRKKIADAQKHRLREVDIVEVDPVIYTVVRGRTSWDRETSLDKAVMHPTQKGGVVP